MVPPFDGRDAHDAADREREHRDARCRSSRRAGRGSAGDQQVATVMPEIGFDDEPISPVMRLDTVTKRKPNSTMRTAPSEVDPELRRSHDRERRARASRRPRHVIGRSRSVRMAAGRARRRRAASPSPAHERLPRSSASPGERDRAPPPRPRRRRCRGRSSRGLSRRPCRRSASSPGKIGAVEPARRTA